MNIRLCYKIDKEAGWGQDEEGNPTEVYSCVKLDCNSYNLPREKYEKLTGVGKTLTAGQFNISEDLITPITLNEYLDNTEED